MKHAALLLILTTAGTTGCATLVNLRGGMTPAQQLHEGAAAVQAQEYLRARGLLEPLFYDRPGQAVGQQALLVLLAAELDNRNPDRRLWAAADMASRFLLAEPAEPWLVPLVETYYVLAMELGAAEERIAEAETRATEARASARLPTTSRESVVAQVSRVTSERDQARRRAEQLQQQLATRERELRETRAELERIRRTIRP
jgi:outer membrane protein assembly factor BamD (BamD/ComL family)